MIERAFCRPVSAEMRDFLLRLLGDAAHLASVSVDDGATARAIREGNYLRQKEKVGGALRLLLVHADENESAREALVGAGVVPSLLALIRDCSWRPLLPSLGALLAMLAATALQHEPTCIQLIVAHAFTRVGVLKDDEVPFASISPKIDQSASSLRFQLQQALVAHGVAHLEAIIDLLRPDSAAAAPSEQQEGALCALAIMMGSHRQAAQTSGAADEDEDLLSGSWLSTYLEEPWVLDVILTKMRLAIEDDVEAILPNYARGQPLTRAMLFSTRILHQLITRNGACMPRLVGKLQDASPPVHQGESVSE